MPDRATLIHESLNKVRSVVVKGTIYGAVAASAALIYINRRMLGETFDIFEEGYDLLRKLPRNPQTIGSLMLLGAGFKWLREGRERDPRPIVRRLAAGVGIAGLGLLAFTRNDVSSSGPEMPEERTGASTTLLPKPRVTPVSKPSSSGAIELPSIVHTFEGGCRDLPPYTVVVDDSVSRILGQAYSPAEIETIFDEAPELEDNIIIPGQKLNYDCPPK